MPPRPKNDRKYSAQAGFLKHLCIFVCYKAYNKIQKKAAAKPPFFDEASRTNYSDKVVNE